MIFLIVDTPICLITQYSSSEALEAFKYIAKQNNTINFSITEEEIVNANEKYKQNLKNMAKRNKTFSFIDLFRYKSLSTITYCCIIIHVVVSLQFYGPALILDKFQLNIFVNGLIIALS